MDSIALPEMPRRTFVMALAGGLLAAPLSAEAQKAGKAPRIGVFSGNQPDNDTCLKVLRSGFSDLGYREGQTHSLEIRWADERGDFSRLARDLVKTKPDLIVTFGGATEIATARSRSTNSWLRARRRHQGGDRLATRDEAEPGRPLTTGASPWPSSSPYANRPNRPG